MAKIISSFQMDLSDIPKASTTRRFSISGNRDSEFNIQVHNNSGAFYDFNSKTFSTGFDISKNLKVKMGGIRYNNSITFPSTTGATYHMLFYCIPQDDDDLSTEFSSSTGSSSKYILSKSITQVNDSTITFAPSAGGGFDENLKTLPTTTRIGSPIATDSFESNISWTVENVENDSYGFGLRLTRQPLDSDWYFQTTETVDGAITGKYEVVVDDLTDLSEGMTITGVSSGSLSGTPNIISINTDTKTLTLSSAQTFADGITLTIKAYGSNAIREATGMDLDFATFTATATQLSKTVRTDISGTTINLNGTYGVCGGGHVTLRGFGVDNSSTNTVQSVSASSSAGSAVVQVSQTLPSGTVLYFDGSARIITITGTVITNRQPNSDRTINLDLTKFLAAGAAS